MALCLPASSRNLATIVQRNGDQMELGGRSSLQSEPEQHSSKRRRLNKSNTPSDEKDSASRWFDHVNKNVPREHGLESGAEGMI